MSYLSVTVIVKSSLRMKEYLAIRFTIFTFEASEFFKSLGIVINWIWRSCREWATVPIPGRCQETAS